MYLKWRLEGSKGMLQTLIVITIQTHIQSTWNEVTRSRMTVLLPAGLAEPGIPTVVQEFAMESISSFRLID